MAGKEGHPQRGGPPRVRVSATHSRAGWGRKRVAGELGRSAEGVGGAAERLRAGEGVPTGGVPAGGPAPRRRRALKGGVGRGGRLGPPWRGPAAWEPKRAEPLPRPELSPSQTRRDASGGREAAAHPAPPARASDATPRGAMVSPASQPRCPLRLRAARFGPQDPSLVRPAPAFDCWELLGLSSFPSPLSFL